MESVVFQDSPLAMYLEGEGEGEFDAENEWAATNTLIEPTSPAEKTSFAPQGRPVGFSKFRRKPPPLLNLEVSRSKGTVARLQESYSSALYSRLGRTENAHFLEQFRYIIVASQLLSEHSNPSNYRRKSFPLPVNDKASKLRGDDDCASISWVGLCLTGAVPFLLAWSIHWVRSAGQIHISGWRICLTLSIAVIVVVGLYALLRRQWLHYVRAQAVEMASSLTASAQSFDAAAAAALTWIQEVELVSRGYRISSPLPPVTRFEEQSQTRRCERIRQTLHRVLGPLLKDCYQAYLVTKPLALEVDLEKYCDIYEISRTDMELAAENASTDKTDMEDADTLKALKHQLQNLHFVRRLFLCSLLALDADGGKSDFARWAAATETMNRILVLLRKMALVIEDVLEEEEAFPVPPTPKAPLTPGRESMRSQMRKLSSLSQGIRGLQAKMHLLREESDKALEQTDEISEFGSNLMVQYDSIGADLKDLTQEWEEGRAALAMNITKNVKRISSTFGGSLMPPSPTLSLGGSTAVGGSPTNAMAALHGHSRSNRSLSSETSSSSGEEVFEAVALPRQRSTLTREERLAKMKEDRVRQAIDKEKANAMLEARLEQANLLKKVVDAIKDLVQDCNFDCNDSGIALQAMDNSHVALVSMMLKAESFSPFRCDRNIALGINLSSLMKVLRCAQNEDILTLKAEDAPDVVNLVFESSESDRLSEYDIKLMEIDQEHLGIPETEYAATIAMPSAEFQRICRDLMALSESVSIEATKEGVKFSCTGDIGNGAVTLRSHTNVEKPELNVDISLTEPVALTFSLKYLANFCKASGLSNTVKLCLSNEVPLLVEYSLASNSYLRFYLAPKIGDEE